MWVHLTKIFLMIWLGGCADPQLNGESLEIELRPEADWEVLGSHFDGLEVRIEHDNKVWIWEKNKWSPVFFLPGYQEVLEQLDEGQVTLKVWDRFEHSARRSFPLYQATYQVEEIKKIKKPVLKMAF